MKKNIAIIFTIAVFFTTGGFETEVDANEPVLVELTNQQMISGSVHSRTNGDRLWLEIKTDLTTVLRPLKWQQVVSIKPVVTNESKINIRLTSSAKPMTMAEQAKRILFESQSVETQK